VRKLYFLLPGTTEKFYCGGLWAELKAMKLAQQICSAEVVTYRQREGNTLFLDDILQQQTLSNVIFVASWGFDVAKLATKLKNHHVIYHAHSAGYGFSLPASVPIITVSRNTLGYWGQRSPNALLYYLPNQISDEFSNMHLEREIDVLVHTRKSSDYLLDQLIPALRHHCRVHIIDGFIDDISKMFNQSKVYLYDSAEYWARQGVSEGFGLQPMEALASGCQVFSSINGGLSDYLDPGFNCYKIAGYSTAYDVQRILDVTQNWQPGALPEFVLNEYRTENITKRFAVILKEINAFFDHAEQQGSDITALTRSRIFQLRFQKLSDKLKKKFSKG
jgi:Glycosyl transferases group 1